MELIKRFYIKFCRYFLRKKYLTIMAGNLKGYKWSAKYSYEYILGNYEDKETTTHILNWFKPDSIFYDLGANVGYYSFLANTKITTGKILAFEPLQNNVEIFKNHIELNKEKLKINNVEIFSFAISANEKKVLFSNNNKTSDGNTYIIESPNFGEAKNSVLVQSYSLDELVFDKKFKPPTILKIDVEGAEFDVLQGAKKTIEIYKPQILLATHNCHLNGVKEKCLQLLSQLNYEYTHTGMHNKVIDGLDDYFAAYKKND